MLKNFLYILIFFFVACSSKNFASKTNSEKEKKEEKTEPPSHPQEETGVAEPIQIAGAFLYCEIDLAIGHCVIQNKSKKKIDTTLSVNEDWEFFRAHADSESKIENNKLKINFLKSDSPWHTSFRLPKSFVGEKIVVRYNGKLSWDSSIRNSPLKPLFSLLSCEEKKIQNKDINIDQTIYVMCDKDQTAMQGNFVRKSNSRNGYAGSRYVEKDGLSGWVFRLEFGGSVDLSVNCCYQK